MKSLAHKHLCASRLPRLVRFLALHSRCYYAYLPYSTWPTICATPIYRNDKIDLRTNKHHVYLVAIWLHIEIAHINKRIANITACSSSFPLLPYMLYVPLDLLLYLLVHVLLNLLLNLLLYLLLYLSVYALVYSCWWNIKKWVRRTSLGVQAHNLRPFALRAYGRLPRYLPPRQKSIFYDVVFNVLLVSYMHITLLITTFYLHQKSLHSNKYYQRYSPFKISTLFHTRTRQSTRAHANPDTI